MTWDEQRAIERVKKNRFRDEDFRVAELSRTMDFANLGTRDVRRAHAAHLYADVPNFHAAVADAGGNKVKQRKLVRAASVLRRVQSELLKSDDLVGTDHLGKIQQQGARLHALCFKPYQDEQARAMHVVVMAISLNTYLYDIFNDVFSDVRDFHSAAGIAAGESLIANIGYSGDRERICLGTPANLAAKVLDRSNTISITEEVYDRLPDCLRERFDHTSDVEGHKVYRACGLAWTDEEDLADELDVVWKPNKWKNRTESYRDAMSLSDMKVIESQVKIKLDSLTERNSRRTEAIAIYADLDGFTHQVQCAEDDDEVVSLLRQLHMIRHEFHAVLKADYPGLVLQHQGDRVFGILHVPCGDDEDDHDARCQKAIDAAIGIQSSMNHVLQDHITTSKRLSVAIGLDVGRVLVSRLGKQGMREAVCLGPCVTVAEQHQLKSSGGEIRISQALYDAVEDDVIRRRFSKSGSSYVARGLTFPSIDEETDEADASAGRLGTRVEGNRILAISGGHQTRPWSQRR